MTNYKQAQNALKQTSKWAKKYYPSDKPAIRQIINDRAYYLTGEYLLKPYQIDLLNNYACKLHPKNN